MGTVFLAALFITIEPLLSNKGEALSPQVKPLDGAIERGFSWSQARAVVGFAMRDVSWNPPEGQQMCFRTSAFLFIFLHRVPLFPPIRFPDAISIRMSFSLVKASIGRVIGV